MKQDRFTRNLELAQRQRLAHTVPKGIETMTDRGLDDFPTLPTCAIESCAVLAYSGSYCHTHTLEVIAAEQQLAKADARALWAYRVIERATLIAGSYSGDLVRHEALLLEKAEALVAADPELGDRCPRRPT